MSVRTKIGQHLVGSSLTILEIFWVFGALSHTTTTSWLTAVGHSISNSTYLCCVQTVMNLTPYKTLTFCCKFWPGLTRALLLGDE